MAIIVGIDLAGKDKNETGFCVLLEQGKRTRTRTKTLLTDGEILDEVKKAGPDLIAMDAPFSFPENGYYRKSDILLKKRGFKPLSPMFPGMKPLVKRAIRLVKCFKDRGHKVIEVFPRASEHILGLERSKRANEHVYDALLCALTGLAYLRGEYEDLEGIIIPK